MNALWIIQCTSIFQRCMTAIFHELMEDSMEVFMDNFSVFGDSIDRCVANLKKMLKRCEETNLVLNWDKCHFIMKEGIVLRHKVSGTGIVVDRAKIEAISKLHYPTIMKAIRNFLCHVGFYRRFIKEFSKIARPMTQLLVKDTPFDFSQERRETFDRFSKISRKLQLWSHRIWLYHLRLCVMLVTILLGPCWVKG